MSKKTLYHSELAKLGVVTARINSEPRDSQFPNKPKWVAIEIGDEERYYNCENDECQLILTGHENDWVELEARGSREDATIRLEVIEKPARTDVKQQIAEAKAKIANSADVIVNPRPSDEKPRPAEIKEKGEHNREPVEQPELPADHSERERLRDYATHAGKIFALAWEESKNAMALIPVKDAQELTAYEWLDLRIRIANGFQIEINKIIRKERF